MKIEHIVSVSLYRKKDTSGWLNRRLALFLKYTYTSLCAQTFQDFTIRIRSNDASRNVLEEAIGRLPQSPRIVGTYGIVPGTVGPSIPECDVVYITRIDSDDVYRKDALELAHACQPPEKGKITCSMFERGLVYDLRRDRWSTYHNCSSPFHTAMIPYAILRDREAMRRADFRHGRMRLNYPTVTLPDWKFCVLRHEDNTMTDERIAALGRRLVPTIVQHPGKTPYDFISGAM